MSYKIIHREDNKIIVDKQCSKCNQALTLDEYQDYKDICEKCLTSAIQNMG